MDEITSVLDYGDAAAVVADHAARLLAGRPTMERLPLIDSLGRVLAAPLVADRDQPPFSRSTRDGFACRAADASAPMRVVGLVRAGESWAGTLGAGEALEIMTGAPVPPGADCVVMVEHVERASGTVALASARRIGPGDNIVPAGAEARSGALVVEAGTRITPAQIAVAAMCGHAEVSVFARPRVAVLATGDELVSVEQTPLPFQIRNSNTHSLSAQVLGAGGLPVPLPPAPDEPSALQESILTALGSGDLLLLSGGVSAGKFDFVEQVLLSLGAEFFFTGAKIQPGKPVVFGRVSVNGAPRYFFGLPGNPVSTMVTFLLFVSPLLHALGGQQAAPRFVQARLVSTVERKRGLTRFLPSKMHSDVAGATVEPIAWQGSGDLAATACADCFVVVPGESSGLLKADEMVSVLLAE